MTSPYESRTLTLETDRVTTAAYMRDANGETLGFCWVANHRTAPEALEASWLNSGRVPLMPIAHTKHPKGRKALDQQTLEVLWFEEGDGVVVLESGKPLCVIPAWSDVDRGMPGYSRDAVGQTPFARSLDEAAEGLGPHVRRAREFWHWQRGSSGWAAFQQGVLGHLLSRLGPGGYWWSSVADRRLPRIGVSERPGSGNRPYTVLSTVGMSCQRMPVHGTDDPDSGEQFSSTPADMDATTPTRWDNVVRPGPARVELAMATTLPSQQAGTIFRWLGPRPWHEVTRLGPGQCVRWRQDPESFPLGSRWDGVILIEDPGSLIGPPVPDLSGFSFGNDPVRWLWVIPITSDERHYARAQGPHALIRRLGRRDGKRDGRRLIAE